MNRLIFSLIAICMFQFFAEAQIIDVYQNKTYDHSYRIFKTSFQKQYAPAELEYYQNIIQSENKQWQNVENKLRTIALQNIENEVKYVQLFAQANKYLEQFNELNRLKDPYFEALKVIPTFDRLEIKLLNISNARGVYAAQYGFGEIEVTKYYLTDLQNNSVTEIGKIPSVLQQQTLQKLTLSKLAALYLIQTRKLEVNDVERIRGTQTGKENHIEIAQRVNYIEAVVYPYFSGLMVEFPENSKTSGIFDNKAFRLLVTGNDLVELLQVYPEFKSSLPQNIKPTSDELINRLNDDNNFDLQRFYTAPKELKLKDILQNNRKNQKPFSLTINNYQKMDTVKNFTGSKKFIFDHNSRVLRIEERNDRIDVVREQKNSYNNNQLTDSRLLGFSDQLKLYNYDQNLLNNIQTIEIIDYQTPSHENFRKLNIIEEHFMFNNNSRFSSKYNMVGKLDPNLITQSRSLINGNFCTNHFCLLTNKNGNVVGVKNHEGTPIDLLVNNNQPIESFLDNNRLHYQFTYYDDQKIASFVATNTGQKTKVVSYKYHDNEENPLTISEVTTDNSTSSTLIQDYEIVFREN